MVRVRKTEKNKKKLKQSSNEIPRRHDPIQRSRYSSQPTGAGSEIIDPCTGYEGANFQAAPEKKRVKQWRMQKWKSGR